MIAKHRLFYMDVARVVAILMVTSYHLWRHFGAPKLVWLGIPYYKLAAMGYAGVDLFFVVSGFAMMMTWGSPKSSWGAQSSAFYRSRLGRILPPYLVAMAFWYVAVRMGINPKPIATFDVLTHLTFTHSLFPSTMFSITGVFWSLAIEVQFYAIFPLLMKVKRIYLFVILGLSAYLTYVIDESAPIAGPMSFVMRWNVITYMPLFLFGMLVFQSRKEGRPSRKRMVAWMIAAVGIILWSREFSLFLASREAVGAALGMAFLRYMPDISKTGVFARATTMLAAASYSIYLYNYVFVTSVRPLISGLVGYLVYFVWVLLFGFFMWWFIERPVETFRHHAKANRRLDSLANSNS